MQGAGLESLVRELDSTCYNQELHSGVAQLRPGTAKQINTKKNPSEEII